MTRIKKEGSEASSFSLAPVFDMANRYLQGSLLSVWTRLKLLITTTGVSRMSSNMHHEITFSNLPYTKSNQIYCLECFSVCRVPCPVPGRNWLWFKWLSYGTLQWADKDDRIQAEQTFTTSKSNSGINQVVIKATFDGGQ